jgi:hypothetical protein
MVAGFLRATRTGRARCGAGRGVAPCGSRALSRSRWPSTERSAAHEDSWHVRMREAAEKTPDRSRSFMAVRIASSAPATAGRAPSSCGATSTAVFTTRHPVPRPSSRRLSRGARRRCLLLSPVPADLRARSLARGVLGGLPSLQRRASRDRWRVWVKPLERVHGKIVSAGGIDRDGAVRGPPCLRGSRSAVWVSSSDPSCRSDRFSHTCHLAGPEVGPEAPSRTTGMRVGTRPAAAR